MVPVRTSSTEPHQNVVFLRSVSTISFSDAPDEALELRVAAVALLLVGPDDGALIALVPATLGPVQEARAGGLATATVTDPHHIPAPTEYMSANVVNGATWPSQTATCGSYSRSTDKRPAKARRRCSAHAGSRWPVSRCRAARSSATSARSSTRCALLSSGSVVAMRRQLLRHDQPTEARRRAPLARRLSFCATALKMSISAIPPGVLGSGVSLRR